VTRVGGEAFDIIESRIKADSAEPFTNAQEVLDAVYRVYGDPNKVKTARREFKHLIQGNDTFPTFYAKFSRLASILNYDEAVLLDELESKVSYVIQNQLVGIEFKSLTSMSTRCALIDQNLQERDKRQGRNRNSTRSQNNSNANSNRSFRTYRTNDNTTQKIVKEEPTEKPNWKTSRSQTTSNDLDRDQYMKEGRCFNCHQVGHRSRDCPKKQIVNSVTDENKEGKEGYSTSMSDSDDSKN